MSSTVTIEELTGQKRRLVLKGGGLPLKGAPFSATTVVATTRNNGNPEATQQVLTSQEDPSDWEGVWSTTQLLGAPCDYEGPEGFSRVGLAFELEQVFDSIRLAGQLLRVTWENEVQRILPGSISTDGVRQIGDLHQMKKVRLGRITNFQAKYSNLDMLQWSATFDWISRGEITPKSIDFRGDDLIASVREAIVKQDAVAKAVAESQLRALRANGFRQKNYASTFTLGQLEQIEQGVVDSVDSFANVAGAVSGRLKGIGDVVLKGRAVPFEVASHALDVANNAVAVVTQFMDEISQKSPEQQVLRPKLSTLTRTASYLSGVQTQAQLMQSSNTRLAQQARMRRSPAGSQSQPLVNKPKSGDVVQTHFPRAGETMVSIALRYEVEVEQLCKTNSLPQQTIRPPHRALIIPTHSPLEQRGARGG